MISNIKEASQEPEMYTMKDIMRIFKCGRNTAYSYLHMSGFPSIQINSSFYVPKTELEKWIQSNLYRKLKC